MQVLLMLHIIWLPLQQLLQLLLLQLLLLQLMQLHLWLMQCCLNVATNAVVNTGANDAAMQLHN